MNEVKGCPLCNEAALVMVSADYSGFFCEIICTDCDLTLVSDTWDTPEEAKAEAVGKWNNRIEPPTPGGAIVPAGNERLRG